MSFEKLNLMYDEIQHFLTKRRLYGNPFTTPLILFIVFCCLSYSCSLHNFLKNDIFEKALHYSIISKLFYCQMPVSALFMNYWIFIIHYIIFEFHYQYNKLLSYYNTIIERNMDQIPIPMTRYFINDSLKKIKINNQEMSITVILLNKINIILNLILLLHLSILIILNYSYECDIRFISELFFIIFLLASYFLMTQYNVIIAIKTQNLVKQNLLKWKDKICHRNIILKCVIIH